MHDDRERTDAPGETLATVEARLRAAPRSWSLAVRDWWPVALVVVAYLALHALGTTLTRIAHVQPQLGFDETLFGGTAPTVRMQDALWEPNTLHWYDVVAWLVYLSHFFVTFVVAVVLWFRDRAAYLRFRAMFLVVTFAGFVTYVVYPAIPPWLASRRGDLAPTVRVIHDVWEQLGLHGLAAVFGERSDYAFPVGALPSLHAAWPFLLVLFFWPGTRRWWRVVLVGYALAMACTLVYSADHFVFDVLLGWAYATVALLAGNWWWRHHYSRAPTTTAPAPVPGGPGDGLGCDPEELRRRRDGRRGIRRRPGGRGSRGRSS